MSTYYVSCKNTRPGNGSSENPFQTIGQAARIARSGDTVIVGGGVYREWVDPLYGGISDRERIVYRAADGEKPVVSGAEVVGNWHRDADGVWTAVIDNRLLGEVNPFQKLIYGDWFDGFGRTHHTGEVYLDGEALFEADQESELLSAEKKFWLAKVEDGRTVLRVGFGEIDPNEHLIEVSVRPCCFFPRRQGVNYLTLSGLEFCQAASQWAPPTAFQPAAVGTHWSKGWIIERCSIHDSKCCGLSVGKSYDPSDNDWVRSAFKGGAQTYTEIILDAVRHGWSKETVGSHYIHHNHIYNCGQTGIVGCMGGVCSKIVANHIHDINNRGEFGGAEMAGIKLHAAIDAHIEQNCIHHCIRGLWLDWEAQGTRVTRNAFFENITQDLFIEVCHGPCVVDNNLFLSSTSFLCMSQGSALVNNLFAGRLDICRETSRFTLYHFPHDTFVAGAMVIYGGDDRLIGNVFAGSESGTAGYNGYPGMCECRLGEKNDNPYCCIDATLPVAIRDNAYLGGAAAYEGETQAQRLDAARFEVIRRGEDWILNTDLDAAALRTLPAVTTQQLGKAFESNQWYDQPDGSALCVDEDYFGNPRPADAAKAGPFEAARREIRLNPEPN